MSTTRIYQRAQWLRCLARGTAVLAMAVAAGGCGDSGGTGGDGADQGVGGNGSGVDMAMHGGGGNGGNGGAGGSGGSGGTGGSGGAGGSGGSGGGGIIDDSTPPGAPTWSAEFTNADSALFTQHTSTGGHIELATADSQAGDALVGQLTFPGSTVLGPNDHVGPGFASELDSRLSTFSFGMYRTRVQLARCAANEDVVNGIFTYFNDGNDHDNDGLIDNSEIDIEILCGTPTVLSLTIWSEYSGDDGNFRKWTRAIDLGTGTWSESTKANEYGVTPKGTDPLFKHPGVPAADAYYELGFEWQPDFIRYFIVLDGREITLWRFTDKTLIPTLPTGFLFNVWHPNEHWFAPYGSAAYPAHDAVMRIDWARYWRQ